MKIPCPIIHCSPMPLPYITIWWCEINFKNQRFSMTKRINIFIEGYFQYKINYIHNHIMKSFLHADTNSYTFFKKRLFMIDNILDYFYPSRLSKIEYIEFCTADYIEVMSKLKYNNNKIINK